ncbi:MAG: DUF362 domain-containing protein [Oscillospiraceae bacterium]
MVSIQHTPSYEKATVQKSIDAHFSLLGLDERLRSDMKVTIKPNLLMKRKPEEATTTHPIVMEAIISHLQNLGITDITLADSPGGVYSRSALSGIYKTSGMEEMANRMGVTLNMNVESVYTQNLNGVICKGFDLILPIVEADFIISVGKLKTHCMTGLSGGVKNLFGCVPGLMKPEFHWRYPHEKDFCNMLLDLCETVKPDVTFVDAVVSMEGDGPSAGDLRETGLTFCSRSPYELDLILAKTVHKSEDSIFTIVNAKERGLCTLSVEKVPICGDELLEFLDFKQPASKNLDFITHVPKAFRPILKPVVTHFFSPRPEVKKSLCIGCGKCAESCPAHTISIDHKKANIHPDQCIKCYCCHEMCPVKAIHVKRNRLLHQ